MRRLIYWMNTSLDGFIESSAGGIDFTHPDEELHRFFNDQAREVDISLYGRRLYEVMSPYWPTVESNPSAPEVELEFARIWMDTPRIVFSRTLERVEWNSRLVRNDLPGEIAKLKAQPGGNIEIGGATLAATAMRHGLVDEIRIVVHPVVLGGGKPFFPDLESAMPLRLLETRTFGSGAVYLRYERATGD